MDFKMHPSILVFYERHFIFVHCDLRGPHCRKYHSGTFFIYYASYALMRYVWVHVYVERDSIPTSFFHFFFLHLSHHVYIYAHPIPIYPHLSPVILNVFRIIPFHSVQINLRRTQEHTRAKKRICAILFSPMRPFASSLLSLLPQQTAMRGVWVR